jgi:uncharacterized protein (DUF2235 family)
MRRLIICCDGSWHRLASPYPTNVVKLAQAIKRRDGKGIPQVVHYSEGVGAGKKSRVHGIIGLGLDEDIIEAYTFLALNHEPGDEVYLLGFSRGAYTVRSLAGMIHCCGLVERKQMRRIPDAYELYRDRGVSPGAPKACQFRESHGIPVPIHALGCWDTVGALGFPIKIPGISVDRLFNKRFAFHDTRINPSVKHAFHAKAIDELREVFKITPMKKGGRKNQVIEETWFPGDHSCVGGGRKSKAPLANRCLVWMLDRIAAHGLGLATDLDRIEGGTAQNHSIKFDNTVRGFYRLTKSKMRSVTGTFEDLDITVKRRWHDRPDYRPSNLGRRFRSRLDKWEEGEAK